MQVTIQLSDELEQKLTERALQLNTSLENLILASLADLVEPVDPDDTPKEAVLERLQASLEDVKAGKVYPIEELWDGIDA